MSSEPYVPIIKWNPEYRRFEVSSATYAGHFYSVGCNAYYDGFECTCPWGRGKARKAKKDCKHIVAVKEWLKVEANKAKVVIE